jgi:NADH dehydrogenase [ubiquinone] 1 alpha subcomplex assembly factor 5
MPPAPMFNTDHIDRFHLRARGNFTDHDFLFRWAGNQILDRLADIRREFSSALILGDRLPEGFQETLRKTKTIDQIGQANPQSPEHMDPFLKNPVDLIVSLLSLHTVNDLLGLLAQIRNSLTPDGLFLACLPGGETLRELRSSLMNAELSVCSGASPRVFPFVDKQQMGALLQRAGYALPVVDSDMVTATYRNLAHLMSDLRGMGENNAIAARQKTFSARRIFSEAQQVYSENFHDPDGRIPATFEMIFAIGWAPHESQQKPLRPGSAKAHLSDIL